MFNFYKKILFLMLIFSSPFTLSAQFSPVGTTNSSVVVPTGTSLFEVPFNSILTSTSPIVIVSVNGTVSPASALEADSEIIFQMCIGGDFGVCIDGLEIQEFFLATNSNFEVKLNILNPSVEQDFVVDIVVSANDGSDYSISFQANIEISGTQNISEIMESQIGSPFPNPFNDFVNIPINVSNEFLELAIFDITGKKLITERVNAGSYNKMIDTSSLPSGLYLISLMDSKGVLTTKKIFKN